MKNKNGEKAKYIYAKIMFCDLFHRTQRSMYHLTNII